jgi:thioester reductase-like protein
VRFVVQARLDVDQPFRDLANRGVSGRIGGIESMVSSGRSNGGMPEVGALEVDYEGEAQLDASFDFSRPLSAHPLSPATIFLTGATGFLGAYLLDDLLQNTEAVIHCLVRAHDDAAARQKLFSHLQKYGLWREEAASRIRAFAGDLSKPGLGLKSDVYQELAVQTDVIYHNAGSVNMALSYAQLKSANVTGTKEVLRLAGAESTKPLHFVSSIAVFYSELFENGPLLDETCTPLYHPSLKGGYGKSKWVADRLVAGAQERGLPASIYRPVRIMGHSRTGAMHDASDLLPLLLKGCILLRKYPALDLLVTFVPVDYVSRAIVHLSSQKKSWGRAFHLVNRVPIEWERLMSILRAHDYQLERVSYQRWWRELKQQSHNSGEPEASRRVLSSLFLAMTAPHFLFYKRPPMDDGNTREGLEGTGIVCGPADSAVISTYLSFWQKSGFLPAASPPPAAI